MIAVHNERDLVDWALLPLPTYGYLMDTCWLRLNAYIGEWSSGLDVVVFIHYGILTAMSGRAKCDSIVLAGSTEYTLSSHSLTGRYGRWGRLKAGFSGPICLARVARNSLVVKAWWVPNVTYYIIHSDWEHCLIPQVNRELLPLSTCKLGYVGAGNFHHFPYFRWGPCVTQLFTLCGTLLRPDCTLSEELV